MDNETQAVDFTGATDQQVRDFKESQKIFAAEARPGGEFGKMFYVKRAKQAFDELNRRGAKQR